MVFIFSLVIKNGDWAPIQRKAFWTAYFLDALFLVACLVTVIAAAPRWETMPSFVAAIIPVLPIPAFLSAGSLAVFTNREFREACLLATEATT